MASATRPPSAPQRPLGLGATTRYTERLATSLRRRFNTVADAANLRGKTSAHAPCTLFAPSFSATRVTTPRLTPECYVGSASREAHADNWIHQTGNLQPDCQRGAPDLGSTTAVLRPQRASRFTALGPRQRPNSRLGSALSSNRRHDDSLASEIPDGLAMAAPCEATTMPARLKAATPSPREWRRLSQPRDLFRR